MMVRREALPYFYFAPMGPDTGVLGEPRFDGMTLHTSRSQPLLNRFADVWMGIFLKQSFDRLGWACYTGGSVVHHTRASDARVNFEQEKLGREWNERADRWIDNPYTMPPDHPAKVYFVSYAEKRERYRKLVDDILRG